MIDRTVFVEAWGRLEERWGEAAGADAYYAFLSPQMDTDGFRAAARIVWATREFFPRPADFLLVGAGSGWAALLANLSDLTAPHQSLEEWQPIRDRIPDRAWEALKTLGGVKALRDSRDLTRLRRDFLDAYERQIQAEAANPTAPSLPPGEQRLLSRASA